MTVSKQSFISGSNSLSATLLNYTLLPFNTTYCYIGKYCSRYYRLPHHPSINDQIIVNTAIGKGSFSDASACAIPPGLLYIA